MTGAKRAHCLGCGAGIDTGGTVGRPRKYCSDYCRYDAYNGRGLKNPPPNLSTGRNEALCTGCFTYHAGDCQ